MKPRLVDLDLAKGIAIFLVVLTHFVPFSADAPAGNAWYMTLTRLVYMFHMPFFMCISGAVFCYTLPEIKSVSQYRAYIVRRANRLLPAFFLFSVIIWGAKEAARHFLHVDNTSTSDVASLVNIVIRPGASIARSLWYIYVLFQLHAIFPLILLAVRGSMVGVVIVSAAIHALSHVFQLPTLFALDQLCEYTLHFGLGIVLVTNYDRYMSWISNNVLLSFSIFSLSFLTVDFMLYHSAKTVIGLASLPAVLGVATCIRGYNDRRVLLLFNEYTFTIYLMNTLFIGLAKGVMFKAVSWDGHWFLMYFPVLLLSGLLGPIVAHRLVLARIPPLGRMTK